MHLQRIKIAGFKSFLSRLEMEFSDGITAILGPNGCGKTNLVDAIRWVLGEQKTRLLRNTKMENVIFNGTRLRKPIGMAEVHLTLSNEDRALPLDYSEVTISRKIYRSGISEYYLNGELTRLKAIKAMFFDTGLGNHAYSIIEREMIDTVLSEKEQDKKLMFEEAAGIMRYRVQREEALRKIELTEDDITRLNDILFELEKEIRSLKYQVGKARRFARLKEQVDRMESALLKQNLHELLLEADSIREEKERQEGTKLIDEGEISLRETELQERKIEAARLEKSLQELREKSYLLGTALQQNDEKIAVNAERMKSARARILEDEGEIEKARERLTSLSRDLAAYRREISRGEGSISSLRSAIAKREEELRTVSGRVEGIKKEIEKEKRVALDRVEEKAKERGLREHLEETLSELEGKRRFLLERLSLSKIDEGELLNDASSTSREIGGKRRRISQLEERLKSLLNRKDRAAGIASRCEDRMARAAIELNKHRERKDFLEAMRGSQSAGKPRRLAGDGRIKGALYDLINVKREHRKCFEACLSPIIESLLAESEEKAFDCLRDWKDGRNSRLQILYPSPNGPRSSECRGKGIVGKALSLLQCEADILDHLAPHLGDVIVVRDVDTALSLMKQGQAERVATLDGVFFDGPGRIIVAPSEEAAISLLDCDAKIEEAQIAVGQALRKLSIQEWRREKLGLLKGRISKEEGEARKELEGENALLGGMLEKQREIEVKLARLRAKTADTKAAERETTEAISEIRSRLAGLSKPLHTTDDLWDSLGGDLSALEGEAMRLEQEKETLREALSKMRLEEARSSGELSALKARANNTEKLVEELQALCKIRNEDIVRTKKLIEESEKEVESVRGSTLELHQERDRVEGEIEEARAACEQVKAGCRRLEGELRELNERREQKRNVIERYRVELAAKETRITALLEKAREIVSEDIGRYLEDRSLFDPREWEELDKERFHVLKDKLQRFGPVNMLAIDEYREKKERYDFLSKQKADLEGARQSLLQAIRKINREARKRLGETFEQIRVNFKTTFMALFGGGEADLLFVDSDDPLEANIKIVANPKGKRLHDISSLSGGERALVALSLLFAIYLVRPSPFCVLDEVDAPLDDANVARFVNMLRSFTDRTQFIVVTHNKKTMEAADYLYGVTMEEPGVSKMISVRMNVGEKTERREEGEASKGARVEEEVPLRA